MKLASLFILTFLLSFQVYSQCASSSNIYTFTYNGKTYEVIKELKSWTDASACAIERGGYLVEINDLNEQNAVYDGIVTGAGISSTYVSIANGGGSAYVWIGGTDQGTEGTWLWDGNNDGTGTHFWTGQGLNGAGDGTSVGGSYINWGGTSTKAPNEPDNFGTGQHHAAMALAGWPAGTTMLGVAGEWNDIIGSSQIYYVVEKNKTSGLQDPNGIIMDHTTIYPNPSNGQLNFWKTYESIEIYNLQGKLLKQVMHVQQVDLSDFEKGTYLFKTTENLNQNFGKFILN